MTDKWKYQSPSPEQLLKRDKLSVQFKLSPPVSLLLIQRDLEDEKEVRQFFNPSLHDLHDPFLLPDMAVAVKRLERALGNKEKILIYGDYDVDGTTAVALIYKFLEQFTIQSKLDYYIPDRSDEGCGISAQGIDYAHENGATLLIALDCGIKAREVIHYASTLGIDVIICDHHTPGEELPPALAVVDAKRTDSVYPYEHLSGCGVGFKFMQAFAINNNIELSGLKPLLDLCAVSIAADIVPITGENRVLAHYGLRQLNQNPSKGLKGIIEVCGLKGKDISISDIVFKIGPRINASGRMMKGKEAVDLLLSKDAKTAREKSENIDQYNDDRRELDKKTTEQAYALIDQDPLLAAQKIIILYNPEWHKGVIGIVASRVTEKYYKPALVLTESNGILSGSARSASGFDIYAAVESAQDLLINFGGHTHAVGLTLLVENLEALTLRLQAYAEQHVQTDPSSHKATIDAILTFNEINPQLLHDLKRMRPYGAHNPKPVFCSRAVRDAGTSKLVGREQDHIRMEILDATSQYPLHAIAFNMARHYPALKEGQAFDICYTIEENTYSSATNIQLQIMDMYPHIP
jgi:single-stranded-DNA-specific exonuclease